MEPTASQVRNHYSQKNQGAHLEEEHAHEFKTTANVDCRSNVSTQPQFSWIVLEIANVRTIILIKQDDDNTDPEEISDNESGDSGDSTLSSDIKED
jgi:hypothetical protein